MKWISKHFKYLVNDSLYKNSFYLMLSTAVMAFFGFFFWIINSKIFPTEQVGIATTLLSVLNLIASISLLGLNSGIIRFLPVSERRNEEINTSFTLSSILALVASVVFLIGLNLFSPTLIFLKNNFIYLILFVFFAIVATLNVLVESVFVAYRTTSYILIKNILLSISKLILPIFLLTLGAYGILMSAGIASSIGLIIGLYILTKKFQFIPKPVINKEAVRKMIRFSLGNHLSGFIGSLPSMVLPIIITNTIGPKFSAYFYMDFMIASFLYVIPTATSQSLFAEGSHSETDLKMNLKKSVKIILLLLIPTITFVIIFGKYILLAFGKEYSTGGIIFLKLLTISSLFISVNHIGSAILNIKHKVKIMIMLNIISTMIIFSLSLVLINFNLLGIGISWFVGQGIITCIYLLLIKNLL